MKEVFDKMIKHPIRTAMIIGGITSGVVSIIHAIKEAKSVGNSKAD